jgi:signal transduction histidine kinase
MKLWPESVRWRLTLWYSLALGVMLLIFAGGSYYALARLLSSRSDRFLEQARDAYITELHIELGVEGTIDAAIRAARRDVRFRDIRFLVYDDSLRSLAPGGDDAPRVDVPEAGDEVWSFAPHALASRVDSVRLTTDSIRSALVTWPDSAGGYRAALRSVRLETAPYIVAALHSRHPLRRTLTTTAIAFAAAIPFFLLLAGLGGYLLAHRALSPLAAMGRQAREISATNLHERLPVANPRDELGSLATLVNDLLSRLEASFDQQRRFIADASHELRTPVAIIRSEADVALTAPTRPEPEYRDALHVVQDAAARLSRIVNDLFLLTRADAGHQTMREEELYLNEVVTDTVRSMRSIAAARDKRLEVPSLPDAPFRGDGELLGRLLVNLIDNAIRYSTPGTVVSVDLALRTGEYRVSVADAGPGIPLEARDSVFIRFFRVDAARSRESGIDGGAGLGLPIARWIAEAHGGRLELERSDASGSVFVTTLPRPVVDH